MDLRFCMLEQRWRGGRCKCGCGSSFVHLEGSAAVGGVLAIPTVLEFREHLAQTELENIRKQSV